MTTISLIVGLIALFFGIVLIKGFQKIKARPPHVGLVLRFGNYTDKVVQPGWRFFFLYPYVESYIPIDASRKNIELTQTIITPDRAQLIVPLNIAFTPIVKEEGNFDQLGGSVADMIKKYIQIGEEEAAKGELKSIAEERLREWATSKEMGPIDFQEAMVSELEAVSLLIKAILGDALDHINSAIPTSILLKFFNEPQSKPSKLEAERYSEDEEKRDWNKLERYLNEEQNDDLTSLKKAIVDRRSIIEQIRRGEASMPIPAFGLYLNQLNIGQIKPAGKLAEALDLMVEEQMQRDGETVELEHVTNSILNLKRKLDGLDFSPSEIKRIVQTERGKTPMNINEILLSPETIGALGQVLDALKGGK